MLCIPEVFFVVGVVGPLYASLLYVLLILGDASYCFVECWALAPAMQSSEADALHCVMHLGVQRQAIY